MMVNGGVSVSRKQMSYFYALVKACGRRLDRLEACLHLPPLNTLTPLNEQPERTRTSAQVSKEAFTLRTKTSDDAQEENSVLQERGCPHFHAVPGLIPDEVRRLVWMDVWKEIAGFSRIMRYEAERGAEFYMSKSTYAWKNGEIDVSPNLPV